MTTTTKTLADLVAEFNTLATAAGEKTRKSFENKTVAEAAIKALKKTAGKSKGGAIKIRKAGATRNPGPGGFKFGPVWLESITAGKGIAMSVANLPKLLATAAHYEVEVTSDLTQEEIAKSVAKAIAKAA